MKRILALFSLTTVLLLGPLAPHAFAATTYPPQSKSGSIGLEGTISSAPPSKGATITTPSNGSSFNDLPITINGICPTGLLVKIFSNNVFIGSEMCVGGSYSIQVSLFAGQNDLVARVYDALDQAGPDSNVVTVNYVSAKYAGTNNQLFLTSIYAERGAAPGTEIEWPIIISGGIGPYAISVDWGDNSPPEVISSAFPGTVTIKHTYKTPGTYKVIVSATDSQGDTAILQLTGVANGAGQSNAASSKSGNGSNSSTQVVKTEVIWWPALAMLPLIIITFFIGQRHELFVLRKRLEKTRDSEVS